MARKLKIGSTINVNSKWKRKNMLWISNMQPDKGIEFLSHYQIFLSQYFCNLMVKTCYISNFWFLIYNRSHSLEYQSSATLGYKDIGIRKIKVCGKNSIPLSFTFTFCLVHSEMCSVAKFSSYNLQTFGVIFLLTYRRKCKVSDLYT